MSASPASLEVRDLVHRYGALRALDGVTFSVQAGERRAVIGPNGAGKTTLFGCIGGDIRSTSGRILLHGREITHLSPHRIACAGLARTFQRNNLFPGLSVFDNVCLAVQRRLKITRHLLRPWDRFDGANGVASAILERVGLEQQREAPAKTLSHGEQRQLEIGLALACEPTVLLLDEPSAGMSQAETNQLVELIRSLPRELTILIIEHDMDVVFALADRITVLHYGRVLAEGAPSEVEANPAVQDVYLGTGGGAIPGAIGFEAAPGLAAEGAALDG